MNRYRNELFWLSHIHGITARRLKRLLQIYPSIEQLTSLSPKDITVQNGFTKYEMESWSRAFREKEKILEQMEQLEERGIHFVTFQEENYPSVLRKLDDKPYWLYYRGKLPSNQGTFVSIVGARNCTDYGCQVAQWLGRQFAEQGISVISGMANGIDTYAHRGALQGKGDTWAVLAGGVDICYPPNNQTLYQQIQQQGGILSETSPGVKCMSYLFPLRNRMIAGLSSATIVVEARKKSGSLITAELALEQGKDVFAVPGRFGDELSEGCNLLIKDGAFIVTNIQDIIEILNKNRHKIEFVPESLKKTLANEKKIIYSELSFSPISMEELLIRTGFSIGQLMRLLLEMEFDGWIVQPMKNYYIRKLN